MLYVIFGDHQVNSTFSVSDNTQNWVITGKNGVEQCGESIGRI